MGAGAHGGAREREGMRERTGAGAFAPERRAHGVSRVPVGCLARLPGSLAREHVSNGDHSVCRVRMIMCVSVQMSARERERKRAGIQGGMREHSERGMRGYLDIGISHSRLY